MHLPAYGYDGRQLSKLSNLKTSGVEEEVAGPDMKNSRSFFFLASQGC